MEQDSVYERMREMEQNGEIRERPLYEAAGAISREEEDRRRAVLAERDPEDTTPLDPELFPPTAFNPDGSRKTYKNGGGWILTPAEERAAFEWRDSRF